MLYRTLNLGSYLQEASKEIYDLLESNKIDEAKLKHKEFTKCLETQLDKISK
jgi:hypothetical protein